MGYRGPDKRGYNPRPTPRPTPPRPTPRPTPRPIPHRSAPTPPARVSTYNPSQRVQTEYQQPEMLSPSQTVQREYRPPTMAYNPSYRAQVEYAPSILPWWRRPIPNPFQMWNKPASQLTMPSSSARGPLGVGARSLTQTSQYRGNVGTGSKPIKPEVIEEWSYPGFNKPLIPGTNIYGPYGPPVPEAQGYAPPVSPAYPDTGAGYGGYGGYGGGGGGNYSNNYSSTSSRGAETNVGTYTNAASPFNQYRAGGGYGQQSVQAQARPQFRTVGQAQARGAYATQNPQARWMQLLTNWRI